MYMGYIMAFCIRSGQGGHCPLDSNQAISLSDISYRDFTGLVDGLVMSKKRDG